MLEWKGSRPVNSWLGDAVDHRPREQGHSTPVAGWHLPCDLGAFNEPYESAEGLVRRCRRIRMLMFGNWRIKHNREVLGLRSYCASKHALEGYSEFLDHEVRQFGIRVSVIEPSFTRKNVAQNCLVCAHRRTPLGGSHIAGLLFLDAAQGDKGER